MTAATSHPTMRDVARRCAPIIDRILRDLDAKDAAERKEAKQATH